MTKHQHPLLALVTPGSQPALQEQTYISECVYVNKESPTSLASLAGLAKPGNDLVQKSTGSFANVKRHSIDVGNRMPVP